MILAFMVKTKLARFPGSFIKPAIVNEDVLENHFSQLQSANGQNGQNSIIFGQSAISRKCNTGNSKNTSIMSLPKENIFGKKHTEINNTTSNTIGLLRK